jgi:hypothetical protein
MSRVQPPNHPAIELYEECLGSQLVSSSACDQSRAFRRPGQLHSRHPTPDVHPPRNSCIARSHSSPTAYPPFCSTVFFGLIRSTTSVTHSQAGTLPTLSQTLCNCEQSQDTTRCKLISRSWMLEKLARAPVVRCFPLLAQFNPEAAPRRKRELPYGEVD